MAQVIWSSSMPLQNRVDPYGRLHAVEARGALMGNRGILHDDEKRIVAPWRLKRWITCTLSFTGRKRQVFAPRRYSELFFLDEATSFAAGHRPCAECRRERYNEFRAVWIEVNADHAAGPRVGADDMDNVLHAQRAIRGGGKKTWLAHPAELPPGTFIEYRDRPHLIWIGRLWRWTFAGYEDPVPMSVAAADVTVLTPQSIVRVFASGFTPQAHDSVLD
jgi:hypothetical protein